MTAALAGFALGFSLILAIGAQNAFVLKQGLARSHVFAVCLTCAISDAILIAAGVGGAAQIGNETLLAALRWGGVAFLVAYGARSFLAAWRGKDVLAAAGQRADGLGRTIAACLAFTWLNPHVYLDTLVLIGSVSAAWPGSELAFGIGAVAASFAFFFGLGYGARLLAPVFARPGAWRVLEVVIGVIMWILAGGLALGG